MSTRKRVAFGPLFVLMATFIVATFTTPASAASVGSGATVGGSVYFTDAYNRIGGNTFIGSAINDVHQWGAGCNQDFSGGRYGSSAIMQPGCRGIAHPVVGKTWQHFIERFGGGAVSWYGYPQNDSHRWGNAWVQDFNGGNYGWNIMIYGDSVGRTHNIRGDIWRYYRTVGGMSSSLGAPTSDEYSWNGVSRQDFIGGSLIWNGVTTQPLTSTTPRNQRAANWAVAEKNSPDPTWSDQSGSPWSGQCEFFVEVAFGTSGQFPSAIAQYWWQRNAGRIHTDTNPPVGALVFYDGGGGYGHVGVSLGGGQVVSTQGFLGQRLPVWQHGVTALQATNPYLGWAYAPDNWPGR